MQAVEREQRSQGLEIKALWSWHGWFYVVMALLALTLGFGAGVVADEVLLYGGFYSTCITAAGLTWPWGCAAPGS